MSKLNCNVVRDILPLYADEVVCEDTRELVDEHLGECEDCCGELSAMREKVVIPVQSNGAETMKKVKNKWGRMQLWKGFGIALGIVAVLTGVLFYLYGYGLPVKAEDVALYAGLRCTTERYNDITGVRIPNGEQEWVVFIDVNGGRVITSSEWETQTDENGVVTHSEIRISVRRSPFLLPWDQTGPNMHGMGSESDETLDKIITIVCADQEISYSMKEEGLWDMNREHTLDFCPYSPD